jgi:iron(III) transport system substrate-binding protein
MILKILRVSALCLSIALALDQHTLAQTTDELVAAAKREGTLEFHAPSSLGPKAVQELNAAFNKVYNLNVRLSYNPSSSFTADLAKMISRMTAGMAPEWDLTVIADNQHATLGSKGLHQRFDYRILGVDPKTIQHTNGSVVIVHGFVLPAYNKKVLNVNDVPKNWEDLLQSRWKGGKLGISSATQLLARLATGPWGEKKTTEFITSLAKQEALLGRLGELYTRLQLGEILVAVDMTDQYIHRAKQTGAPVAFAENVEPVIALGYNAAVLKGSPRANLGHLFTAFLTTLPAQHIWEKYMGQTSAFVSGTKAASFVKGRQTLFLEEKEAPLVGRLADEYIKILGFSTK